MSPGPGSTEDAAEAELELVELVGGGNVGVVAASGAALAVPQASVQSITVATLTANCAVTLAAPEGPGEKRDLYLIQDATGSRTVTWAATGGAIKWNGAAAPTLTTTANHTDRISLVSLDGVNWIATASLNYN